MGNCPRTSRIYSVCLSIFRSYQYKLSSHQPTLKIIVTEFPNTVLQACSISCIRDWGTFLGFIYFIWSLVLTMAWCSLRWLSIRYIEVVFVGARHHRLFKFHSCFDCAWHCASSYSTTPPGYEKRAQQDDVFPLSGANPCIRCRNAWISPSVVLLPQKRARRFRNSPGVSTFCNR